MPARFSFKEGFDVQLQGGVYLITWGIPHNQVGQRDKDQAISAHWLQLLQLSETMLTWEHSDFTGLPHSLTSFSALSFFTFSLISFDLLGTSCTLYSTSVSASGNNSLQQLVISSLLALNSLFCLNYHTSFESFHSRYIRNNYSPLNVSPKCCMLLNALFLSLAPYLQDYPWVIRCLEEKLYAQTQ